MANEESNDYILGTEKEELFRLGVQHQIWSKEAQNGWKTAGFTAGQTILDLGCGPGFCSKELGFLVGHSGKIIGIDLSKKYINYLNQVKELHGLNIEGIAADFNDMELDVNTLDGMYCRWALAWFANPKEILEKVKSSLKVGGKMVLHEYYDWSTHQTEPQLPNLSKAIKAADRSFREQEGDIDVGRQLPKILSEIGMKVTSIRPMSLIATPKDIEWNWPKSFYEIYFPKLVEMGLLTEKESTTAWNEMLELEKIPGATLFCPMMVEVIAEKV